MECRRVRDLLSEYIDGYLDPRLSAELRVHLDSCPLCSREHAELSRLVAVLRSTPPASLPAGFQASLHGRLVSARRRAVISRLAAAAALAACVLAYLAVRPFAPQPQPPSVPPAATYHEQPSQPALIPPAATHHEQPGTSVKRPQPTTPTVRSVPAGPSEKRRPSLQPPSRPTGVKKQSVAPAPAAVRQPDAPAERAAPSRPVHPPSLDELVRVATVVIRERGILDALGGG